MIRATAGTVATLGTSIQSSGADRILPHPERMISALRQVGYTFEQAISDLVDNSINGRASNVLIRFVCDDDTIRSCVVADDGEGMSEHRLAEAMRFGSTERRASGSLGKYGMGLKLASLSHASQLTVVSRQERKIHGRRWTVESIGRGWECETLKPSDALSVINCGWGPLDFRSSGTLVIWDKIDKLPAKARGLRSLLRSLHTRLDLHLGMCFHRFLDEGSLRIFIDQQRAGAAEHSICATVNGLDPFAYPHSGKDGYPKIFRAHVPQVGVLEMEGHIWPPYSDSPAYKLGNKTAARQGFYFYRNNRLIQAGGWNGVVQHETEPHSSLARIRIKLPASFDGSFGLNVQKSAIVAPPVFQDAVTEAVADDGETFEEYRRAAQLVYRQHDGNARRWKSVVPRNGLPKKLRRTAAGIFAPNGAEFAPVDFEWTDLPTSELFRIEKDLILLNSSYRRKLMPGVSASGADAPLFKLMLFLLLRDDLEKQKPSVGRRRHLEQMNLLLSQAAEFARG